MSNQYTTQGKQLLKSQDRVENKFACLNNNNTSLGNMLMFCDFADFKLKFMQMNFTLIK